MKNVSIGKMTLGGIAAIIALVFVFTLGKMGEDVKNNQIVVNQYPFTGKMEFWTTPGFRWQMYGKTTEYYKTNQVWFDQISIEDGVMYPGDVNPALKITYSDKGEGYILGSVRIELPINWENLDKIQAHYGSEKRLIEELVKPTLGKVITACGPLMSSLESVSEKRTDLIAYATDQLNNGVYATKVKSIEAINQITGEKQKMNIAEIVQDENAPGGFKRQEDSPFAFYGIKVSQLSIVRLEYEAATKKQISVQREADMESITAKAEAAKAIQKTIQIEEEGKQQAAKSKWEQEAIKIVEVTKAQQAFEVAELQAKEAVEIAKKVRAEGEAKAAANRALVSAGLTPLERATIEKETKIGVAEALSKLQLPKVVSAGSAGNGQANAMDAMGLKMMIDIVDKVSSSK
jgi:hypothetical protein